MTAVINELGGEKIDIIEYSEDPEQYIANSLSPAKIAEVRILPKNKALVICPEDQLSLAIGREGQNVRLAAKLTGWKIDVRGPGKGEVKGGEEETTEERKPSSAEVSADDKAATDKKATAVSSEAPKESEKRRRAGKGKKAESVKKKEAKKKTKAKKS